jgi:cation transport regulator
MPYVTNADLPKNIRHVLPHHAQNIYREAFNNAFESYRHSVRREEVAHRVAWAAVKKGYVKRDGAWIERETGGAMT